MSSQSSSPFSTGGGGQFFEAKVQASFLLHLLIGGRIPCLPSGGVQSIRLQARQAGIHTDDVLVKVRTEASTEHHLFVQIKHHATVRASDKEFCEALQNAWLDFNNQTTFSPGQDALALVTGPQSDQMLQHIRPLLDWARTSATEKEFVTKVSTAGFSSDKKRGYLQVFRDVLTEAAGTALTDNVLWQFLRHLYFLSYDFDVVEGSRDEASILTVLETARAQSSSLDAQAIWQGLIIQAQEWNKTAGTFTPSDLPSRLLSAVQPQRSPVQREAVSRLQEHCDIVLGTINTELASGIRLPRTDALDLLANAVESARVVVVQGPPGSGKSAAAKMFFETLFNGITPFAFKAQEFNHPHIHQFLTSMGVELTVAQLRCELALLPRKVVLIDGAERLFELNSHEAFRQLLHELQGDESWTVVITCRESSAQLLREHLLAQWGADVTTITIPPLNDEELKWVLGQAPHLAPLIVNQKLVRLLRLPFILSLAWKTFAASAAKTAVSDIDERQFKDIVWKNYVERTGQTKGALSIKRGQCLLSVSVERARQMSVFVSPQGYDAEALDALVDDGILIKSKAGGFVPAHDVLEDWAVVRFIAQQFEAKGRDSYQFVNAVGTEPAMRRSFRLWLSEALAGSQSVMDFVLSVFQRADVLPVWQDEIAVALMQSENAGDFIRKVERLLLDGNKAFYRRLVHVLRTACKGSNELLLRMYGLAAFRSHVALGSIFVVPVGNGWREIILFTHRHLDVFDLQDSNVVLGLLKDWAQGVGVSDPLSVEAPAVAQICLKYWALLTAPDLYADRLEKEFLQILFKIPHAVPDQVDALIRSALADERARRHHSRTVLEHVTKSIECQPLCAHFPNLVIEVAEKTWCVQADDEEEYRSHRDLEEYFGFQHSVHFNYFPQSALQGPFTFLLASHPELGVDFIVRLANQAALSYSQSEIGREVYSVQLPTGTDSRSLLASPRLWALYRSMMPGPQVLECALMALEAWLLAQAKQGNDVRKVFRRILDTSSSVGTIAVLASVAVAYPAAVGEEILPILQVPEFYRWDFQRSHLEGSHISDVRSIWGFPTGGLEEIYYKERKESSALLHRRNNLEELVFRLQWTSLRDRIWSILDELHKLLPPEAAQSEEDKTWRIALHRMDARHFKAIEGKEPGQVVLTPGEPTPDLQQFITKAAEDNAPFERRMRLANWGVRQFRRDVQTTDAFPDWRDALHEAQFLQEQQPAEVDKTSLGMSGPCFVASYLVRDHYDELQANELEWCRRLLIEEVLRKDAERTFETRISKNAMDGSRPAAAVLPLLLRGDVGSGIQRQIEECLATAVTHTSEEVRDYAAAGIREWLWETDAGFAKACVGGLFDLAGTENHIRSVYRHRLDPQDDTENAVRAAIVDIRAKIVKRETVAVLKTPKVDLEKYDWPEMLDALNMLRSDVSDPDLRGFVMENLAASFDDAEAAEGRNSRDHHCAHYEFQYPFAKLFAQFALAGPIEEAAQIGKVLSQYIERCPKYLGVLLEMLPYEEDRVRSNLVFWTIWKNVSDPIFQHDLLRRSSRVWRYDQVRKLVRVLLFADTEWKKDVKEWEPVTANRDFFEHAAEVVGNTESGFGALLSLLCTVGQVFLPDAVRWLSNALERAEGRDLLSDQSALFQLEILLRKLCYGYGSDIRQRPELHRAVLMLLDRLVESGSHTGFRLRDYIVAPLPLVG